MKINLLFWMAMEFLAAGSCHAAVAVRFDHPENFADFSLSGSTAADIQSELAKQFEAFFKLLGERYLPKGDALQIEVLNIDMAGAYEPWQTPNLTNTRFMRDIYPPKISLHYQWRDEAGKLKADRQEIVSDLNYPMWLDARQYNANDPLRYEKVMLEHWFRERFSDAATPMPQ